MKTLIINGSPKKGSCSEIAMELISQMQGANCSLINLKDYQLNYCQGCLLCEDKGVCPQHDDGKIVLGAMQDAGNIVLVTPVYFDNVPAMVKNLIDRSNLIVSQMKGKKIFLITTGQADEVSWKNCNAFIKNYCEIVGAQLIMAHNIFARKNEDLQKEKVFEVIQKVINIQ